MSRLARFAACVADRHGAATVIRLALVVVLLVSAAPATPAVGQGGPPPGILVPNVDVRGVAGQAYALYLPSAYTPARSWPVILAFDPGARGQTAVERYRQAAEAYGYIVAGSNTSRNYQNNDSAVVAMANDVLSRFNVNVDRVYTAGMSGGARVALGTALASNGIAGVVASSAGYPDATPRRDLPFVIFATAGTEDFNHLEMRRLDQALKSPHRLVIFDGGHTWLSSELAVEAVEWLEVQAIKSKRAPADASKVNAIYDKRAAAARGLADVTDRQIAWASIAADFAGLHDVTEASREAAELGKRRDVTSELRRRRDEDDRETDLLIGIKKLEAALGGSAEARSDALADLDRQWRRLSATATGPADSPERRIARRVLSLLGSTITTKDEDYLEIITRYRYGGRGRRGAGSG
jgi:poly(3-hydroxybutyrate) depolymerase